ncbi:MAG: AI-2E family transporter [Dehalococcoidia bacterium]
MRLEVPTRTLWLAAGAFVAFIVLSKLWSMVLLLAGAAIVAVALLPAVRWLIDHGLPRPVAVFAVGLAFISTVVLAAAITVPAVVSAVDTFTQNAPRYASDVDDIARRFGIESLDLERRARNIDWGSLASGSVSYGSPVLVGGLALVTVLFIAFYLLLEMPAMGKLVFRFVPRGREAEVSEIFAQLAAVVGGYVRGQALTSLAITAFTFVVLMGAGTDGAIAIALIAGIADVIPIVGAFVAIVPAVLATLEVSTTHAIAVLVALVLYQQFEDRILVPRIYAHTLGLSPLVVLLATLGGAQLLGIVGVLLALPAVAAGRVLLEHALRWRRGPPAATLTETLDNEEDEVDEQRGVGKCANEHLGAFGFPSRPNEPYPFCPECGSPMVWACGSCDAPLPDDATELVSAHFCRMCGTAYFPEETPNPGVAAV